MLTSVRPLLRSAGEPDGEIIYQGGPAEVVITPGAVAVLCQTLAWRKLADPRRPGDLLISAPGQVPQRDLARGCRITPGRDLSPSG